MVLESIDYKKIFYYFEKISSIPRGSRNNQAISDYLVSFAKERGLYYIQDAYLNVIIIKEAAEGYEDCPAVILQGHMDMVCEKNQDTEHDFTQEGLELILDGDMIRANGTTLGGDDGIAVAYALSILDDETLALPRIEVIITTDEEIGMDGAAGLDCSVLKGRYMLNLDQEEEGTLLTSCAGGMTSVCHIPLSCGRENGMRYKITISGLKGGHSGIEIDKNRTNADLLLGRLLSELHLRQCCFSVIEMHGGLKDNAIPREAFAEVVVAEQDTDKFSVIIGELEQQYKKELMSSEPELSITGKYMDQGSYEVLDKESFDKVVFMLLFTPNGIQKMSSDVKGLVESSLNLGIFHITEGRACFSYSVRSSKDSYKIYLGNKLKCLAAHLGGDYQVSGDYPSWEYRRESRLREICIRVFREQYSYDARIEAIHAGLECGIIAGKIKDLDIISIGPDIFDIHTPLERMSVSSVIRVYQFVIKVIEELCEKV